MEWLFPSIVATLLGTLVLAATYFYLYKHDRQKFLLIWGAGWLVYATRFMFMLLLVTGTFEEYKSFLLISNQLCALFSGLILLHGTFVFTDRETPKVWFALSTVAALWIISSQLLNVSFLLMALPTYLFLGIIYVWTGIVFLRHTSVPGAGKRVTGGAFILWGIHKMDYPFLRPVAWFAPWGYLIGATIEIIVAIGILIIYFNKSREELRQSKEKIQESEEKFRAMADTSPLAIYMSEGVEQKGVYMNPTFTKLFGYTIDDVPTIEQWWPLAYPDAIYRRQVEDEWRKKVEFAIETKKEIEPMEVLVTCKDGSKKNISWAFITLGKQNWACGLDLTERKQAEKKRVTLETQLRQSHKMEAIGTLAGGIAHDFNNILSAVMGYTELAMMEIDNPKNLRTDLDEVLKGAKRATALVRQILTLSRKSDQELQPLKVQFIVKEALKFLHSSIPSTIEITQNIDSDCQTVLADPTQIHQIIMNLCTNAYHAMRDKGGVLAVSLQQVVMNREEAAGKLHLKPGGYVKLEVSDSGTGMKKDVLTKIFEPYYTTKEKGEGTGLGLAVVHGIVTSLGGDITVYSEQGMGTTFTVYLPTTDAAREAIDEELAIALPRGEEHILLVDDDESIVFFNKKMLEKFGYTTTALSNSLDALKIFQNDPDSFDLVVTDMTMPSMTGAELAKEILAIRPNCPIILCSGYSDLINEQKAKEIGIRAYVMKPVNQKDYVTTIRKVLDASSSSKH